MFPTACLTLCRSIPALLAGARRGCLPVIALFLMGPAGETQAAPPDGRPPNIVLIYVDDLGYGDLGCQGSPVNDTPHIDRLAAQGLRFTDYYSASPVCSPSRAALLTGCYPARVGFDAFGPERRAAVLFPGDAEGLHPDEQTLAEVLRARGYATAHVGKWHLGDQPAHLPTRHGFDSYYGIPYSNDMAIMPRRPNSPPLPLLRNEEVIQEQPAQAPLIERYTEECVTFLRANRDRPFFLYLAHLHVHLPHYVMDPFASASRNGRYGAAVAAVDWSTGVLMAELRRLGLEDNTVVVFTSDNGSRVRGEGGSNGPLRGMKGQTWEGGMRVPCIVRWPARIRPGGVCHEVVSALDFYPTFARLAGQDPAALPRHDGSDVLPLWEGGDPAPWRERPFFYFRMSELQAVRIGPWKLRHGVDQGPASDVDRLELYDLGTDIGETRDVAAAHPEVVRRLTRAMEAMRGELGDSRLGIPGSARRPPAKGIHPRPLTPFDPEHPYIEPSYTLDEAG